LGSVTGCLPMRDMSLSLSLAPSWAGYVTR